MSRTRRHIIIEITIITFFVDRISTVDAPDQYTGRLRQLNRLSGTISQYTRYHTNGNDYLPIWYLAIIQIEIMSKHGIFVLVSLELQITALSTNSRMKRRWPNRLRQKKKSRTVSFIEFQKKRKWWVFCMYQLSIFHYFGRFSFSFYAQSAKKNASFWNISYKVAFCMA